MARTSKIFYGLVGVLLLVIAGLIFAIAQQRESLSKSRLKARLDEDAQRIDTASEKARLVTTQLPLLRDRVEQLEARWQQVRNRLYIPTEQTQVENFLKQTASAALLEFVGVEKGSVEEAGDLRAHTFHVRMSGNQTNLPAWADQFYRQRRLARIERVSVVSPDLQFQKFKLRATVRYFEPRDPADLGPGDAPLDKFDVDLNYLTSNEDVADPLYGKSLEVTRQKAGQLKEMKGGLDEAAKLEKRVVALEKLIAAVRALDEDVKKNRAAALENLPTLYIRVRNSPVGSAALLLAGNVVKFPELAGDE